MIAGLRLPEPFHALALPVSLAQAGIGKLSQIELAQALTCLKSREPPSNARHKPLLLRIGRSMHLVHRRIFGKVSRESYGERRTETGLIARQVSSS